MRNGIVDDATGALERIAVDPADFDMTGKVAAVPSRWKAFSPPEAAGNFCYSPA